MHFNVLELDDGDLGLDEGATADLGLDDEQRNASGGLDLDESSAVALEGLGLDEKQPQLHWQT